MSIEESLLTPERVREYLSRLGLVANSRQISVSELGGGVSNVVFLIEGGDLRWVLKQSLAKLRVKDDWRSDRDRIFREAEAIQVLRDLLGNGEVPDVIYLDREHFLLIMTAAPVGAIPWKDLLLKGQVDLAMARQAGEVLARIIAGSRLSPHFRELFLDRRIFDQLRITPYYRTTAARDPDVRLALEQLISDSWNTRTSLVHGDYSPKNMLVCERKMFLIDFEVVHWGDPAFDAGFLLTHLLLKAFHRPQLAHSYLEAAREFWKALDLGLKAEMTPEFESMTIRHLGGLMLARIDGKSPVEYIVDENSKERVRRLGKSVLLEPPRSLGALMESVYKKL